MKKMQQTENNKKNKLFFPCFFLVATEYYYDFIFVVENVWEKLFNFLDGKRIVLDGKVH